MLNIKIHEKPKTLQVKKFKFIVIMLNADFPSDLGTNTCVERSL